MAGQPTAKWPKPAGKGGGKDKTKAPCHNFVSCCCALTALHTAVHRLQAIAGTAMSATLRTGMYRQQLKAKVMGTTSRVRVVRTATAK